MMERFRVALFTVGLAALVGCGNTGGGDSKKASEQGGKTAPTINPEELRAAASKLATEFLTSVKDRKANAASLTPEFKKVFAPPAVEADKSAGFNETGVLDGLKILANEVGTDEVKIAAVSDSAAFAVGKNKAGGRTILRITKAGTDAKIDWLSVGPKMVPDATLNGDDAPGQFAVQAFLDAVFTRQFTTAESLLSDAGKNTYGKSAIDGKFNFGALKNKLEEFFGGFEKYTVTGTNRDGNSVKVTVELPFAAGKKTGTIKAVKGSRAGEWKVEEIEVK